MELKKITGIDNAVAEITAALSKTIEEITETLEPYTSCVITEDELHVWKKDRAKLNKERKSYNDERIAFGKDWASKVEPITAAYKQIDSVYAEAIFNIDKQTSEYEAERIRKKQERIKELFKVSQSVSASISGEWANTVSLEEIYIKKWENASVSEKEISDAMASAFLSYEYGYNTISEINHKYKNEGIEEWNKTHDLQRAIVRMNALSEQEAIIEAKRKAEEDAKAIDIPADEEIYAEPVFALPEDMPKHIVLRLEIRENDIDRLLNVLDEAGIYYHLD